MMVTNRAGRHFVIVVALCWLLLGAFVLWVTAVQSRWVYWVVLALPGYVLGELFFSWLLSRRHGIALSRSRFSFTRIAAALIVAIGFVVASLWVSSSVLPGE